MEKTIPTRYQAAIMRGDEILLIKHREHAQGRAYWVFPGGGREAGETASECVQREVREETHLEVEVQALLFEIAAPPDENGPYQCYQTYLCHPITQEAAPGYEPEPEAAALYAIVEVGWFNLWDENTWDELIRQDPITTFGLRRVRKVLDEEPRLV